MRLHAITDYTAKRYELLKLAEGDWEFLYVDNSRAGGTLGVAHIGIGVNLFTGLGGTNHAYLALQYLGFDLDGSVLTGAARDAEREYLDKMLRALGRDYVPGIGRDNAGLAAVNQILQDRLKDARYAGAPAEFVRVSSFELTKGLNNQTGQMFEQLMQGYEVQVRLANGTFETKSDIGYELKLDRWLNNTGVAAKQQGLIL